MMPSSKVKYPFWVFWKKWRPYNPTSRNKKKWLIANSKVLANIKCSRCGEGHAKLMEINLTELGLANSYLYLWGQNTNKKA